MYFPVLILIFSQELENWPYSLPKSNDSLLSTLLSTERSQYIILL